MEVSGETVESDLLVIGSGFAGLWAAIAARDAGVSGVVLVDKGAVGVSSTSRMAAGATIFCLPRFDPDVWLEDFVSAQGYLCRQDIVSDIIASSNSRLEILKAWGVQYRKEPLSGRYLTLPARGLEHTRMLVAPRWKCRIGGSALVGAMLAQVRARGVVPFPKVMITSLLVDNGRACGAVGVDRVTGEVASFRSRAVVLAAADCSFRGNYACVDQVTGDAFRLAFDAGVRLNNLEFLCVNTGSALYGFEGTGVAARLGGRFLDRERRRFMKDYRREGDKAEVCHLVQAMVGELAKGNGPPFYFDMSGPPGRWLTKAALSRMGGWMPLNIRRLADEGIDVFSSPQEWLPAVQSLRGGVRTGADCMSDLPGLFAAGTSQSVDPGLFNGWSSMRAMWSGQRAGTAAAAYINGSYDVSFPAEEALRLARGGLEPLLRRSGPSPDEVCRSLQEAIFGYGVCITKTEDRLRAALVEVEKLLFEEVPAMLAPDPHELVKAHETANMARAAQLFLLASLERRESRGDHFRKDFPAAENGWLKWVNISRGPDGRPAVELEPVPFSDYRLRPAGAAR